MCNKRSLAGFPKQATLLNLKYGCTTVYNVDLGAVNFTGAVQLMDCVIFVRIMNYPWELPARPEPYVKQNKQPVNKDILTLFKCFTSFIFSSITHPKLQLKLHYR